MPVFSAEWSVTLTWKACFDQSERLRLKSYPYTDLESLAAVLVACVLQGPKDRRSRLPDHVEKLRSGLQRGRYCHVGGEEVLDFIDYLLRRSHRPRAMTKMMVCGHESLLTAADW